MGDRAHRSKTRAVFRGMGGRGPKLMSEAGEGMRAWAGRGSRHINRVCLANVSPFIYWGEDGLCFGLGRKGWLCLARRKFYALRPSMVDPI